MRIVDLAAEFLSGRRAPPEGVTPDAAAIVLTTSASHLESVSALHVARSHSLFLEIDPSHRAVLKAILALPELSDERPPGCRSTSTTSSEEEDADEDDADADAEEDADEDEDKAEYNEEPGEEDALVMLEEIRGDIANMTHTFYTAFAISQVVAVASMIAVTAAIFGVWRDLRG